MAKVMTFEREDGLFDWKLIGDNGEDMCGSLQGYTERNDAYEGFQRCVDALLDPATVVTADNAKVVPLPDIADTPDE